MKRDEQHKKVIALREHEGKMTREDKGLYLMLLQRDSDDEDLDAESLGQLKKLHERYVPRKTKEELERQWKKMTDN